MQIRTCQAIFTGKVYSMLVQGGIIKVFIQHQSVMTFVRLSIPRSDAKVILTIRDNDENWFNSWYKFNEKMNTDVNRENGGLFASYGTFFMSLGLSGQKWKWHLEVGQAKKQIIGKSGPDF